MAPESDALLNQIISHDRIVEKLGDGGMGVVRFPTIKWLRSGPQRRGRDRASVTC